MRYLACVFVLLVALPSAAEENWTQFRGPNGDGMSLASNAPTTWSEDANVAWKSAVPGQGWSSPVTDGKTIWLTTAVLEELTKEEQDKIRDEEYKDHMIGGALVIVGSAQFRAIGIDAESGNVLHDIALFKVDRPAAVHSLNSYASPTPVLKDGRLYCHFGSYGTVCLETKSQSMIWQTQLPHKESVGPGSSPAIFENMLIVACDGVDEQYVVALDIATGEQVWRTDRPAMEGEEAEYHKSFSTPTFIEHEERQQAVVLGAQWIASYNPETGEELWRMRHGKGFSNAVRPLYGNGNVIFTTGFYESALIAVAVNGSGDVTDTHVTWRYDGQLPTMPSPLLVGDNVYFVGDRGVAECIDATNGERKWRHRLGGNFSASPIHAAGNLYFGNREGEMLVIAAEDKYKEVATNKLNGSIMASPAMIGEDLLIRTDEHLYRISNGG